jgi:hypothetical protein
VCRHSWTGKREAVDWRSIFSRQMVALGALKRSSSAAMDTNIES